MAIKVSKYMSSQVVSIKPDMGIREAFFLMKEHSIRHLPIVDDAKQLIGIISDRDDKSLLLVANQDTDTVVTFRVDQNSGMLTPTGHVAQVPTPVCLQLLNG